MNIDKSADKKMNVAKRMGSKDDEGLGSRNLNPNKYISKELREQNKRIHSKYSK